MSQYEVYNDKATSIEAAVVVTMRLVMMPHVESSQAWDKKYHFRIKSEIFEKATFL